MWGTACLIETDRYKERTLNYVKSWNGVFFVVIDPTTKWFTHYKIMTDFVQFYSFIWTFKQSDASYQFEKFSSCCFVQGDVSEAFESSKPLRFLGKDRNRIFRAFFVFRLLSFRLASIGVSRQCSLYRLAHSEPKWPCSFVSSFPPNAKKNQDSCV